MHVDLDPAPRQHLTTLNRRDPVVIDFPSAQVANPFRGLLQGTGFSLRVRGIDC
jgi:hypothetical protein